MRSLRRELADAVAAKIEAQRQVRDLEQQLNLQDERAQEQIRKLERQVATLKKDLAAATTTASSDSSAPAVTVTSSEGGAAEEEEKGGEGEGEGEGEGGAARLSNLTSGRAAPATKRKPATRRVAAVCFSFCGAIVAHVVVVVVVAAEFIRVEGNRQKEREEGRFFVGSGRSGSERSKGSSRS